MQDHNVYIANVHNWMVEGKIDICDKCNSKSVVINFGCIQMCVNCISKIFSDTYIFLNGKKTNNVDQPNLFEVLND